MNKKYGVNVWVKFQGLTASDIEDCAMRVVDDNTIDVVYVYGGSEINVVRIDGISDLIEDINPTESIMEAVSKVGDFWTLIMTTPEGRVYVDIDQEVTADYEGPGLVSSDLYFVTDLEDVPEDILAVIGLEVD